jgi:DNA-binding Lrp family transcriptional regulator
MTQRSLDQDDRRILKLLQQNCKLSCKEIAADLSLPITTVYARIKRMEQLGIVKAYKAVLDGRKLERGATSFILASFAYRPKGQGEILSQRDVARDIASFDEVQEVHIITGDWDILIKTKTKDVDAVGKFVIDKLRTVKGIEKTLTCMVFDTLKETSDIGLP